MAAGLLPALLHRIQNNTQLLVALRSLLDVGEGGDAERCATDLVAAGEDAHEQGWLLGVIAAALGADLLLAREEPRGLEPTLRLARDGLRRVGRDLAWRAGDVPALPASGAARSGRLCAGIAALAWDAAHAVEGGPLELAFACGDGVVSVRGNGGGGDALEETFAESASLLAGCAFERDGVRWRLDVPAEPPRAR